LHARSHRLNVLPADYTARPAAYAFLLLALALPWTIAPMSIATGLCGALTLFGWLNSRSRTIPATPVMAAVVLWLVALLVAAGFAEDPGASWPRITKGFFPLLVVLAAFHGAAPALGRRAVGTWLVSAALAAIFGLILFALRGAGFEGRARGAVGHYMTFAGQLLLLTMVAAGITFAARRTAWRIGAGAAGLVGAVALGATYTRSAWLGAAAGLAFIVGRAQPRWLPALALTLAAIVVVAPGSFRERLASAFDPSHPANIERTHMWNAGLAMFRDHPWTGVGLQDLRPIYERYRPPEAREAAGHLHSVPIHIAATMGVIGLVAFLWLYGSLLFCAAAGLGESLRAGGVGGGVRLGVTGALIAFLVAGLFEWNLGDEELLYPLYTLAGLAWVARHWDDADPASPAAGAPHS
jgi:O-antigen ligase